jgi:glycosyltransferase involved in cell wall biosynthesis
MKILLLNDRIPPENRGGAGEVVWRLAKALHASGHDPHVIAATPDKPFEALREGIPTYHLHSSYPERWRAYLSLYNPQTANALRDLYRRIDPDVIHAHNIHADLSYHSLTLARQMGIPTVFTSHDVMPFAYFKMSYCVKPEQAGIQSPEDYRLPPLFNLKTMRLRYNPLRNLLIRRVLRRDVLACVVPSQALADAHAANGLPPFTVIPNGLDAETFAVAPETIATLRAKLGLQGRKVILFAGRLTTDKGTHQLLAALQRIVVDVPEATLLVLSSHPIEAQINQPEYAALRANHVLSGGWLTGEELAAAYHLADVVAVPSIVFDTFPTVILEAMAAHKPVIATCWGGAREIVQEGATGYIINPYNIQDFAAKLKRLLTDDALSQRMGAAGYARLQNQFSMQQQVARLSDLYHEVLKGH